MTSESILQLRCIEAHYLFTMLVYNNCHVSVTPRKVLINICNEHEVKSERKY